MTATIRGISPEGRSGHLSLGAHIEREFTVVYKVTTDDRNDGQMEVSTAFGVPQMADVYQPGNEFDPATIVIDKNIDQVAGNPFEWEVTIVYSTEWGESGGSSSPPTANDNPLAEPIEITTGFVNRRVMPAGHFTTASSPTTGKDWEVGILAPNGEAFNPAPIIDLAEPTLNVKRNVQSINREELRVLANSVNSTQFDGADSRCLRMSPPTAQSKWHKLVGQYWTLSYQLVYRWETWDIQLLNHGSYYWPTPGKPDDVTSSTPLVKEVNGFPVLVNLTTAGMINTTATPTFTRIRYYRELEYNALGII